MNRLTHYWMLVSFLFSLCNVVMAADAVATVNGKPLKKAYLDQIAKQGEASGQKMDDNARRNAIQALIDRELLVQEAEKAGINKSPDFITRAEMARDEMLANIYLRTQLEKTPVDDAALKAEYEKFKQQIGNKEYKVRQIAVASEDEAKALISQLSKGADFSAMAKEKSTDQATKANGGDIGWVIPAQMRRPFGGIVSSLPKGLYNTIPVRTESGWVVLKVDDIRDHEAPALEKMKEPLTRSLRQQQTQKIISDLRAKAKVVDGNAPAPADKTGK
jgi:peptidyl-prolyl cis-trans isomerase C